MEIFATKNLIIRNLKSADFPILKALYELNDKDLESVNELQVAVEKAENDDFNSEGVKRFAIEKNGKTIGHLGLAFDKPYVSFSYKFFEDEDTRINAQDLIFTLVRYVHKLYPHREINVAAEKFDYKKRSVLENLSFNRKSFNAELNTYTYSIFVINPNK